MNKDIIKLTSLNCLEINIKSLFKPLDATSMTMSCFFSTSLLLLYFSEYWEYLEGQAQLSNVKSERQKRSKNKCINTIVLHLHIRIKEENVKIEISKYKETQTRK